LFYCFIDVAVDAVVVFFKEISTHPGKLNAAQNVNSKYIIHFLEYTCQIHM
jgi:hypothetical protein